MAKITRVGILCQGSIEEYTEENSVKKIWDSGMPTTTTRSS